MPYKSIEGFEEPVYMGLSPEESEKAKEYCRNNITGIIGLEKAPVDGYICPFCGSGSGPNGTGMTTRDGVHHHCWSCGESWDVFDMAQELENKGLLELEGYNIFDKVYNLAGLYDKSDEEREALYASTEIMIRPPMSNSYTKKVVNNTVQKSVPSVTPPDYRYQYQRFKRAFWGPIGAKAREYMHARGIGDDILKRFVIGYAAPNNCSRLKKHISKVKEVPKNYPISNDFIDTTNGMGAVVIPVSKDCYVLRNLNKESIHRYAKVTVQYNPFKVINSKVLFNDVEAVFIVEGYIDILSVEEVGFSAVAIGTNGTPIELQKILKLSYEKGCLANKRLVICEDNDKAGATGLAKIKAFLGTMPGVQYCCCDPCEGITDSDGNSLKDANDALVNNRERFRQNLEAALHAPVTVVSTDGSEEEATCDISNGSLNCEASDGTGTDITLTPNITEANNIMSSEFSNSPPNVNNCDMTTPESNVEPVNELATVAFSSPPRLVVPATQALNDFLTVDSSCYIPISTGICELNEILGGGLRTGLTGIVAMSGFGKSTLSLQITDNVAEAGLPVLYISLEMPITDLISKCLARLMWQEQLKTASIGCEEHSKSSVDILTKNAMPTMWKDEDNSNFSAAVTRYQSYADKVFFVEGGMVSTNCAVHTVDRIEQCMKDVHHQTGIWPLVIVDYVQKLKGATMASIGKNLTEKQIIDESVYNLRQLATKYNVPVIGILSMNRAGYKNELGMSSSKGSGDIEYSCDVLIGLEKPKDDFPLTDSQEAKFAKEGRSRSVVIRVIKNRYGVPNLSANLDFYGKQCSYNSLLELDQTIVRIESQRVFESMFCNK